MALRDGCHDGRRYAPRLRSARARLRTVSRWKSEQVSCMHGSVGAVTDFRLSHTTGKGPTLVAPFFFFQAEDGIRDYKVTGVQTCALPIYAENIGVMAATRIYST